MRAMMVLAALVVGSVASATNGVAQNPVQKLTHNSAATVTNWHTQNLFDPSQSGLRDAVSDPLVNNSGHTAPLLVGVGGFLGLGERDGAVPDRTARRPSRAR